MSSKGDKDRRSVNWRNASDAETEDFIVINDFDEHNDDTSVKSDGGFAISQWPSFETLITRRPSSIMPIGRIKSNRKLALALKRWCSCACAERKKTITGSIEGPKIQMNTTTRPIEYFYKYQGNINPQATAIIAKDGKTTYTFERLNLLSDHFAFLLKPIVEAELQSESFADLRDHEPCIAIALAPSEKCVIAILAIWKLGLPYLPIKPTQTPASRISIIIDTLKPIMAIGMEGDKILKTSAKGKCKVVTFEDLWSSTETELQKSNNHKFSAGERMKLLLGKLRGSFHHDPFHSCLAVFHRFNGNGDVTPIFISSSTAWCLLYNEWDEFPFARDEKAALYISTDSHEFLWQMLSPLLDGITLVVINSQDIFGLIETTKKWNISRLIMYPQLLRSLVTLMEVLKLAPMGYYHKDQIFQTVKVWFCTGATIRRELAISFFKIAPSGAVLVNLYGCCEALSFVCHKVYKSIEEVKKGIYYDIIPIGRPVMNTRIYVFDALGKMTEGSTLGEIYVSGLGISSDLGVHVSSFSQSTDDIGPATMPNHYFEDTKDDGIFKTLLRTGDYGRLVNISNGRRCFKKDETTLTFTGHTEGEVIIENYRININEIYTHLKSCAGVKGCHVIVYRPGTSFKEILAFIVASQKNTITKEMVLSHLRRKVPENMVPTLIFIPGIPVKNFRINKLLLIEFYQRDTIDRRNDLISTLELQFRDNPKKLRTMNLLFRILFKECSLSTRWTSNYETWDLTSLIVPETAKPAILKELIRNGYNIGVEEFFKQKSVQDILLLMIKYDESKMNLKKVEESDDYVVEVLTNEHKKEFITFFARSNCGTRYKSIAYYCTWRKQHIEESIRDIWPLIISQRYSILVRHKRTKKIVGAMLNVDHHVKNSSEQWASVQYPVKHRCDLLDQIDEHLTEKGLLDPEKSLDALQNFYFVTEPTMFFNYDHSIHIQLTMYKEVLKIAQEAGFHTFYTVIFDYLIADNIVDALKFEVVDTKCLNLFTAKDGSKPFSLVPDAMNGIALLKRL